MRTARITVVAGTADWLRRHRPGATALLWAGSMALLIADVLAADLVPGPSRFWHYAAAGLAIASVIMFSLAMGLGVRYLLRQRSLSAWARSHAPGTPYPIDDTAVSRDAARGIAALEAFLARQKHTH